MNLISSWTLKSAAAIIFAVAGLGAMAQNPSRMLYLDCSLVHDGNGSLAAPWNSIDTLNTQTLEPGDTVHLRRGTACHGVLSPHGFGADGKPIRITAYGEGPRPKIIASANVEEALRLFNQEYWEIDSLDIAGGSVYGIFISGAKGVLHHIYLSNLAVHDVLGGTMKHKESGLVAISPSSANAHFDDVRVDGVDAWHTNQWVGILVGGGNLGFPPENEWNTNAVIRNSTVHDVQGDGIVLFRVRKGLIDSTVAWSIGMQDTQTIGTPNAIWTWMCDDCTVQRSEAYLTDSPGVDGGAFDIDYGNTKNSVLDSYGHDTQGYCVAVFGAGFVTRESVVRGNLCINNGRSPRMAKYQGAIFLWTWNGGSIDGLTVAKNAIYWNPFENAPPLLNRGNIKAGTAAFNENSIYSTSPSLVESNANLAMSGNSYMYFGSGAPEWKYAGKSFSALRGLKDDAKQESGAGFTQVPLSAWHQLFPESYATSHAWTLDCVLPVTLDEKGLIADTSLRQLIVLKSVAQQYAPQGLRVKLELSSADSRLFHTEAFRNALTDANLRGIEVSERVDASAAIRITLRGSDKVVAVWKESVGPVPLGLALRKVFGEPAYAQMNVDGRE
ncbi:MAG TPA: hypothetical protein VGU25_00160 [Acidobacteriaceae bacterium]|nr:hypothetical protein [Acidobacteriaceae bacterium]